MIRVRFFASLRDIVGEEQITLDSREAGTPREAFSRLLKRYPELGAYQPSLLVAVNEEYAEWDQALRDGDEVAFFPPVSGGSNPRRE